MSKLKLPKLKKVGTKTEIKKEDPKDYKVYKEKNEILQENLVKDLPEEEKPKPKRKRNVGQGSFTSPWGNPGGRAR